MFCVAARSPHPEIEIQKKYYRGYFFYRAQLFDWGQKPEFGSLEHYWAKTRVRLFRASVTSHSYSNLMESAYNDVPEKLFFGSPKVVKNIINGLTGRVTARMITTY